MRVIPDKPLRLEASQGLPDRSRAHPEAIGQIALPKRFPRLEVAGDNELPEQRSHEVVLLR